MLTIALLKHIQKNIQKFATRRQLMALDVSRYEDLDMTRDEIRQEKAKATIMRLAVDLLTLKRE